MNNNSPVKAFLVILVTALVCSSLVSATVVVLRPIQLNNKMLDRSRNIIKLTGLTQEGVTPSDEEMLELYRGMDVRIVDIDQAEFNYEIDPLSFDQRRAVNNPDLSVAIPADQDVASLGRRSRFATVYAVLRDGMLDRLILPIHGAGMWAPIYAYVALESDFNTIAAITFYEQNETPGLGDQITHDHWLEQWHGKKIYSDEGEAHFSVSDSVVQPGSLNAPYQVDALTGATVTGNAVTGLVRYWFGPHGYSGLLENLKQNPPSPVEDES